MKANRILVVVLFVAAGLSIACGNGGGGGGGSVTPPSPTAKLSPSSIAFGNVIVNVASGPQTVTLTNNGPGALNITSTKVTGTDSGDFQPNSNCGATLAKGANCTIAIVFTPPSKNSFSATLVVTDNATGGSQQVSLTGTGYAPALTISPTTQTVKPMLLGDQQVFNLNAPATCTSVSFPTETLSTSPAGSGYAVTYSALQQLPAVWTDTFSCKETADPTQTVSVVIPLEYPLPVITGTSQNGSLGTIFLFGPSAASFSAIGSGFLPDGIFNPLNDTQDICGASPTDWNDLQISFVVGYTDFGFQCSQGGPSPTWDPGFIEFTVSDPQNGHGGGTSNVGRLAFLGDQNLLAFNQTDAFLLDPATSTVRKFKVADGSPDGSFTFTPGTGLAIGIDDVTGDLVLFTGTSFQVFDPVTNNKLYELDAASPGTLHGGAVGNGWAVLSSYDGTQGLPNVLDAFNLQDLSSGAVHVSVKNTPQNSPWTFQVTTINGSPAEVVWSVENGVLSTIALPSLSVIKSIAVQNVYYGTTSARKGSPDGWQLAVFNSGPLKGTAVLLSQVDNALVYIDLATMTQTRRVDLSTAFANASPPLPELQSFRIGKDEADGSVVVAFADPVNGKTVLYNVDQGGNITPLQDTASYLATGIRLPPDGSRIYLGNRSTFASAPKQ